MSYCCTSSITFETKIDDFGIISIDGYCIHVAMDQLYKGDHFIQKSFKGEDKNKEVTTNVEAVTSLKIGYHILDNNSDGRRNRRFTSRRPVYRGRITDNTYARNRTSPRYSNDRRY